MTANPLHFKVGTRSSELSRIQTADALDNIKALIPAASFDVFPYSSPGDENMSIRLDISAPDFFTKFLDDAVIQGEIDCAIHSAKDLPEDMGELLDWFWLPWGEDARDSIVVRADKDLSDLGENPIIGVSSDRRESFCRDRFPGAVLKSIRGNIRQRLEQLDAGDFDILIVAAAALVRLNLTSRITEWISLSDLETPPGQGRLALTFRRGDRSFQRLRGLFVKPVVMVGSGPGHPEYCTEAGIKALRRCDICLFDALSPTSLLERMRPDAERVDVGKRRGSYAVSRESLDGMIGDLCRQGKKVVRLKGGDPGIFGRLAEEVGVLQDLGLPYRVIPGVSSLNAATTGTGLLLTRRGQSRGFTVITPRLAHGNSRGIGADVRRNLALAVFMAVDNVQEIVTELLSEGRLETEPAAMIFGAGTADQTVLTGSLRDIAAQVDEAVTTAPGLLLVGKIADSSNLYSHDAGALENKRVLITCSDTLQEAAAHEVMDYNGVPVEFPLIRLDPEPAASRVVADIGNFDWITLTSPAAVRCLFSILAEHESVDIRSLPRIMVSGAGVARVLRDYGVNADIVPTEKFSADSMQAAAGKVIRPGDRVLRLRSELASGGVEEFLAGCGAVVTDCVLYRNTHVPHDDLPPFDSVFFASSSAVIAFVTDWGSGKLNGKVSVAIGAPTARALEEFGLEATVVPQEATVAAGISALAAWHVGRRIQTMGTEI